MALFNFNYDSERSRKAEALKSLQQSLYAPGQMATQPQQGPMLAGQPRPDITAQGEATGLLSGRPEYAKFVNAALATDNSGDMFKGLLSQMSPQQQEAFTLSSGQTRFGGDGSIIATGAESADDKSKTFESASKARKEFTNQSKDFIKVRDAYRRIGASAVDPSAAGDMAMIFNYMKVLDPGSTVREGEYATAKQATGVPGYAVNLYNQAIDGKLLNVEQRDDFLDRAKKLYEAQLGGQAQLENQYIGIAERGGLNPKNVIVNYRVKSKTQKKKKKANNIDQDALDWANANPNDPRSAQILKLQGSK